jgi:hypothetical protein
MEGESMIFPKGKVRHQDLMTSYTDLPALLATLKSEGFSGTIEIEFPENKGVLFIDTGELINAEAKVGNDSKRMIGLEAVQYLLTLSNQKDGVLNIYQLLPEQVAIVASNLQHEILFKELSTDFTRLEGLLHKLREEKHNGFIEVLTKGNQPMGVLFLEEGEPVEMYTLPESGPSVFGRKSIPIFVESVTKQGAIFNVYRSPEKVSKKGKGEEKELEKEEVIVTKGGKGDLKDLIPIFRDVLSRVEKWVDDVSQRGTFLKAFNRARMEKSGEYFFLDPFSGEFDYRDGTVRLTGETSGKDFGKGIIECLRASLPHLEKEFPKNRMLPLKLRASP